MPSKAQALFANNTIESRETISVYEYLESKSSFRADFNLRFVWIASVSAFDHYISQLILERATEAYAGGRQLTPKLLSEAMSFNHAIRLSGANKVDSILIFREILRSCIFYRSFQQPDKVSDGLAFIWNEKHKWQALGKRMGRDPENLKKTLEGITERRNVIAHAADYDEGLGAKLPVHKADAIAVVDFLENLVNAIDEEIVTSGI